MTLVNDTSNFLAESDDGVSTAGQFPVSGGIQTPWNPSQFSLPILVFMCIYSAGEEGKSKWQIAK